MADYLDAQGNVIKQYLDDNGNPAPAPNTNQQDQTPNILKGGILDSSVPILQRLSDAVLGRKETPQGHPIAGPGLMEIPGVSNVTSAIEHKIDPTDSPFYSGVRPFVAGATKFVGDTLASGFDPRAAGVRTPKLTPEVIPEPTPPSSLHVPDPVWSTPDSKTAQFGLHQPEAETNPLLSHVPNRLRPPSTNATVFDALLPERFKYNEQGAATRLSTSVRDPIQDLKLDKTATVANEMHPNGDAPPLVDANKIVNPVPDSIPPAGQPIKDISPASAWGLSADKVLMSRPQTKPIAEALVSGFDDMKKAIGTNIREAGSITQGMNNSQLEAFGRLVENPSGDRSLLQDIPDLDQRLKNARTLFDRIFDEAHVARKGDLGYIEDYITHIKKLPDSDLKSGLLDIFNYRQNKQALQEFFSTPELQSIKGTGEAAGIAGKGVGEIPESAFTKTRTGEGDNLDYNFNRIARMYIESMARESYLRPAVDKAVELTKGLPDSNMKELSEWLIKNTTKFDSSPGLRNAMNKVTNMMINTTTRSMLGFNPRLQELHLMRLGPVYSELGAKYSLAGLKSLISDPIGMYKEAASLGMLPNEIMPFKFQTLGEKTDSIVNFKSMVDFIDRTIAYNGFKTKFLEAGLAPEEAAKQALQNTKRVTFMVDSVRANKALNAGDPLSKLAAQYKHIPAKIAEWLYDTSANYKNNPAAAKRLALLLGANTASYAAGGPSVFHMPTSLADFSAASVNEVRKILTYVAKGDVENAFKETALLLTPAGKSIERSLR